MQVFPVAMSLIASYVSGVTILGTPAEIYNFGTQYWIIVPAIWIMGIIVAYVYLPVFCKLQVNSSFNRKVRSIACLMFIFDEIMFLPILIYVPSLAFNQVTGVNVHVIGTIVSAVCIFYTVIGGLKAVVWTDTLQIIVMFFSVIAIVIVGTFAIGGPTVIWNASNEGGRLIFFNFDTSLYERHTFWSVLIGGTFYWTAFNSVNQTMVQRYMSLNSLRMARRSLALFTVGVSLFVLVCCYTGLIIYTTYGNCDPSLSGLVAADDQMFPVFVMQTVGHLAGIPGLFVAGVFGAALSSLSVVLNSTAAVLLEDIVKGVLRLSISERMSRVFVKGSSLVLGLVGLSFLFIVEHLGGVLSVATSLSAIAAGTTFGVFTLGMLVPWADSTGAGIGALAGALISGWISFGSQYATAAGLVRPHKLPVSVDGCGMDIMPNVTFNTNTTCEYVFPLYKLSYHWIAPAGVCTVLLVGALASYPGRAKQLKRLNIDHISPVVQWLVPCAEHNERSPSVVNLKETQETAFSNHS
ncbi:Sodium/solute co-transporter-like 5A11 [Carabus blaptoides fortunei]